MKKTGKKGTLPRKTLLPDRIAQDFIRDMDSRHDAPKGKTGAELFKELKDIQVLKAQHYMPTIAQLESRLLFKAMEQLDRPELDPRGYHMIAQAYGSLMKHLIPASGDIQITATQTVHNYTGVSTQDCATMAQEAAEALKRIRAEQAAADAQAVPIDV